MTRGGPVSTAQCFELCLSLRRLRASTLQLVYWRYSSRGCARGPLSLRSAPGSATTRTTRGREYFSRKRRGVSRSGLPSDEPPDTESRSPASRSTALDAASSLSLAAPPTGPPPEEATEDEDADDDEVLPTPAFTRAMCWWLLWLLA